jgi:ABC-type polar amino acid transport system ATPase subunit
MVEASVTARLNCIDLSHRYGSKQILQDLSFMLADGETIAVMGKSGSGKSTLLQCLALLVEPVAGICSLEGQLYMRNGRPLYALREIRRELQLVAQDYNLFPNMTAFRNITLGLQKSRRTDKVKARTVAREVAARLGIEGVLAQYPDTLSGGQAQRVALARAMVLQPSVLLLDEITAALDPESASSVIDALLHVRSLDERGGLGIVMVTHLLHFAERFADRIAFLHEGRFVDVWPAKAFAGSCLHPEAKAFVERSNLTW